MWGRMNLGRPNESEEARRRSPPREHRCPAPFGAIPAPCGEGRSRQPLGWGESGAPMGCRPLRIHLGQQTPLEAPARAAGSCPVRAPRAHGCAAKNPNPRPGSPAHPRAHRELWSYLQLPTSRGLRGSSRITAPGPGTIISQGQRRISALQRARPSTPPDKIIPWCCSQGSAAVPGLTHMQPRRIFRLKWQLMLEQSRAVTTTRCATGSGDGAGSDTHPWGGGAGGASMGCGAQEDPAMQRGQNGATARPRRGHQQRGTGVAEQPSPSCTGATAEPQRGHRRAAPGPVPSCTRATTEPYWGHL